MSRQYGDKFNPEPNPNEKQVIEVRPYTDHEKKLIEEYLKKKKDNK